MTVSTLNTSSGPYTGNGVTVDFSYTFRIDLNTQIIVYETDLAGAITPLALTTDYTVAGLGVDGGGLITRVAGALPAGFTWYIKANYNVTQETSFSSQGGFLPSVHESAMDKLTFLVQQLYDLASRTVRLEDSDPNPISQFIPANKLNKVIGFGANGNIQMFDPTLTSGMIPLSSREAANGVAGLDANLEVIKPQAGAAAQVALGRTGARKRADGTWDGVNILLPNGYDLHLWADDLVSGQVYNVYNPANAPSAGWWHVEILRYSSDIISNQYRTLRLTAMVGTADPIGTIFTSTDALGTWSAWEKFNIGGGSGWQPVTLLNGFTKTAGRHFGIRKTPDGTVTVSGELGVHVAGQNIAFVIPAGFQPNTMVAGDTFMFSPAAVAGGFAISQVALNSPTSFFLYSSVLSNQVYINHSWQVI